MNRVLATYLESAKGLTLPTLAVRASRKALREARRTANRRRARSRDLGNSTYWGKSVPGCELARLLPPMPLDILRLRAAAVRGLTDNFLSHRFDLLGSGWTRVAHGVPCRGIAGYRYPPAPPVHADPTGGWITGRVTQANETEARARWNQVSADYEPIDWHLDFRSGYRWRENLWYRDVGIAPAPGADVKVPRELGRMQHLVQLAVGYALSREGWAGFLPQEIYPLEFRNQILDFTANNPPRFGVNWACTMEVAIRVANWCVAFDLFRASGETFDPEFSALFSRTVFEHALHITGNLEWNPVSPETRGNHYLANVVGLLFASAYLPASPRTDAWLAFAVQELLEEVQFQFYPEGSNVEASTGYHRLSTELAVHATALVQGLPENRLRALSRYEPGAAPELTRLRPPGKSFRFSPAGGIRFPQAYLSRLQRAGRFTETVTKPDGRVHQVGDQDSGRFLKLVPTAESLSVRAARRRYANLGDYTELPDETTCWEEDFLDHRHVTEAARTLFGLLPVAGGANSLESWAISSLVAARPLPAPEDEQGTPLERFGELKTWQAMREKLRALPPEWLEERIFPGPGTEAVIRAAYPAFGVFVFRGPSFYLAVRTGTHAQNHAHNDALALELFADGRNLIADPGSYTYTALPEHRNVYRSVHAHDTPFWPGREPARLDLGLFHLCPRVSAECLYFGPEGFLGHVRYRNADIFRLVELTYDRVTVLDVLPPLHPPGLPSSPVGSPQAILFSPGYGKILAGDSGAGS